MNSSLIEALFKTYPLLTYKKSETMIRAEEPPEYLYYLEKGYVRQYIMNLDGDELTINIYKPKSLFFVYWLFETHNRNYYFEALTLVKVYRAPVGKMLELIEANPQIIIDLTKRLAVGLQSMTDRVESLAFGKARERVAAVLFNLAARFGIVEGEVTRIQLPVTHKLIASVAGLARETTSLEIESLEREGIITKDGRFLVIYDANKLKAAANVNY